MDSVTGTTPETDSGLPPKNWRLEHVVNLMAAVFFGFGLGGLLYAFIANSRKNMGDPVPAEWSVLIGAISLYGTALPALRWFVRKHSMTATLAFGLNRGNWTVAVFRGVFLALAALPVIYVLQWLSVRLCHLVGIEAALQSNVKMLVEGGVGVRLLLAVVAVGFAPMVEELIFRGVLFPALRDLGFPRFAFWATSLLFGLSHFNVAAFLPLTAFGAMLTWAYGRTGNLLTPWVAHLTFNLAPFVMVMMGWKFPDPS